MSDNERSTPQFFNYPTPKDRDAPFEAAPPAKNPIFKGLPLHYLSTVYDMVTHELVGFC